MLMILLKAFCHRNMHCDKLQIWLHLIHIEFLIIDKARGSHLPLMKSTATSRPYESLLWNTQKESNCDEYVCALDVAEKKKGKIHILNNIDKINCLFLTLTL